MGTAVEAITLRTSGGVVVANFTKGELKGPFGLMARDVRLQITRLKITAQVDRTKL